MNIELRDYFAGIAMQTMSARVGANAETAAQAYRIADVMLEARNTTAPKQETLADILATPEKDPKLPLPGAAEMPKAKSTGGFDLDQLLGDYK